MPAVVRDTLPPAPCDTDNEGAAAEIGNDAGLTDSISVRCWVSAPDVPDNTSGYAPDATPDPTVPVTGDEPPPAIDAGAKPTVTPLG